MLFLLMGIAALGWAGYSLVTGKGHYKGCPPGGYDRGENPWNYWAPTIVILGIGVFLILVFLEVIPVGVRHR